MMSINIMLEMCFWSWKTLDIVNKEKSVNEEKSKAGPATRVPYSENQGPLFFLAKIAIVGLVLRLIYTSSMYFLANILRLISVL